jgi:hypothetical protein
MQEKKYLQAGEHRPLNNLFSHLTTPYKKGFFIFSLYDCLNFLSSFYTGGLRFQQFQGDIANSTKDLLK